MYDALTNEFSNHHLNNPDISIEQRDAIKSKIRKMIRIERRLAMIKTVSITAVIIIIITLVFLQNALGQGIVSEENSWNVLRWELISNDADTEFLIFDGDSIVDAMEYKIMRYKYYTIGIWAYAGLLREEAGIVYFIPPDGEEGILYDFNREIGDTCSIINFCTSYEIQVYITNIDTVEYFGIERKRLILTDDVGWEDQWIEGIGSFYGPIHGMSRNCNPPYLTWDLLCYHRNDTLRFIKEGYDDCIYTHTGIDEASLSEQIEIYPNPARDKFEVRSAEFGIRRIELHSSLGIMVSESDLDGDRDHVIVDIGILQAGIYYCRIYGTDYLITKKIIIQ